MTANLTDAVNRADDLLEPVLFVITFCQSSDEYNSLVRHREVDIAWIEVVF